MLTFKFRQEIDGAVTPSEEQLYRLQLSNETLCLNAAWFIKLRWYVIGFLLLFSALSVLDRDLLKALGVRAGILWPVIVATALFVGNYIFRLLLSAHWGDESRRASLNLWIQICYDLVCLTVVVHFLGTIATPAPALYTLHVALTCVFFSARASLFVCLLAVGMYLSCFLFESIGILPFESIFVSGDAFIDSHSFSERLLLVFSYVVFFVSIWYVVSKLATIVKEHEKSIIDAEERLRRVQKERDQYAVQMTHQLKAPLDAIRSSLMLIVCGYVDPVSDSIKQRLEEMDRRAAGLGSLILGVLRLYRLQKESTQVLPFSPADLAELLQNSVVSLEPLAKEHNISIDVESYSMQILCVPEQIETMLSNVISNAVVYSHEGGRVAVKCSTDLETGNPVVSIRDRGIGIHPEKISQIFTEYYYTEEAFKHNTSSTGIGLAIVRKIAERHKIDITVDSILNEGSTFTLHFPG